MKGMANEEHLEKLSEGVEAWNQWRMENRDLEPETIFNGYGILKCFHAGSQVCPFGMAEVVVRRARREDQVVIVNGDILFQQDKLALRIHAGDFPHQNGRVPLEVECVPQMG